MHWSKLSELSQLHSNPKDSSTIDLARDISDFPLTQLRFLHHSQQSSLAALMHRGNWWAASCSIVWIWRYFQLDKSSRLPPKRWKDDYSLCAMKGKRIWPSEERFQSWEIATSSLSFLQGIHAVDQNIGPPFSMLSWCWAWQDHTGLLHFPLAASCHCAFARSLPYTR